MHYRNGREAKVGDDVVQVANGNARGILYDTVGGVKQCSARVATVTNNDPYVSTSDLLHAEDVKAIIGDGNQIPDSSIKQVPPDTTPQPAQ